MKFFKIAVVTFLMLCSASTGAMAAIVEDYSGWRTSYQWVSSWENWTDTIDLSGLNLSQGDGLMIEVSFSGTNT